MAGSVSLIGPACTRYSAHVTAYLSNDMPFPRQGSTCAVVARSDMDEPLLAREVTTKVEVLLEENGYEIRPVGEARYALVVYFSINSGERVSGERSVYVPGGTAYTDIYTSSGQWATATTQLPGRTERRSYSYTVYTRYLQMSLYDHDRYVAEQSDGKDSAIAWSANTVSAGSSSDLRSVVDYLLVATFEHFGSDTGKQVSQTIFKGDSRVKALRDAVKSRSSER